MTLLLNLFDRMGREPDGTLKEHIKPMYLEHEAWRAKVLAEPSPEYKITQKSPEPPTLGPNAFRHKVAVLVDAACGSSCESSLEVLRRYPKARVFGERTGGFIHFGDVGALTLPNSGIRLGIPSKYLEYPDGVLYDKVGFEVDQPVPAGTDAYAVALGWITAG